MKKYEHETLDVNNLTEEQIKDCDILISKLEDKVYGIDFKNLNNETKVQMLKRLQEDLVFIDPKEIFINFNSKFYQYYGKAYYSFLGYINYFNFVSYIYGTYLLDIFSSGSVKQQIQINGILYKTTLELENRIIKLEPL